jgi:hypothetical protein
MTTLIQCDQCRTIAPSSEADKWLQVWRREINDELSTDLCTFACLIQWAITEQDRKVGAK